MTIVWPVTNEAPGPQRKTTAPTTSSGTWSRCKVRDATDTSRSFSITSGCDFTPSDIVKVERLFEEMVAKLPKADRLLAQARFAVRDLPSAREFLGLEVTQELLMKGLRRLTPESLVAIRGLAQESRTTLAMRFAEWSQIDEVAVGMNRLSGMSRPGHVADLFAAVGS